MSKSRLTHGSDPRRIRVTTVGVPAMTLVLMLTLASGAGALASASSAFPLSGASGSGFDATTPGVTAAIAFRDQLGLADDAAYVAALEADTSASRQYGIAMTASEVKDIDQRVAVQTDLDDLTKIVSADPDYAGLWLDQKAGGEIVIETVGDEAALIAEIDKSVPAGGHVRVDRVAYSLVELTSLQAEISAALEKWTAAGVNIVAVGADVLRNRVVVNVAGLTAEQSAQMIDQYGPMVLIEPGEPIVAASCVDRTNCGSPIKGGL